MLELTDTFAAALTRAKGLALAKRELGVAEQESLLALPGFDGSPYLTFLEELRSNGVEIEAGEDEIVESPVILSPERPRKEDREDSPPDLDLLNRYISDLGRYPTLTVEEEKRYAREARAGNDRSRTELILGNLREEDFWQMADGRRMREFRLARPKFCCGCRLERECQGGCKAAAEACYGSVSEMDPFLADNNQEAMQP